jgi:tRNA A58 N-methylase Trm61
LQAMDAFRQPQKLMVALSLRPGQRVAEVGAGGGYLTPYLAAAVGPSGHVVATDIDEESLRALRRRTDKLVQVTTRYVQPSQSGLEPAYFDLILLADVVHLLPQPAAYLRALCASLRPGGRIVVSGRIDRRAVLVQAATQAGLLLSDLSVELPAQFVTEVRSAK